MSTDEQKKAMEIAPVDTQAIVDEVVAGAEAHSAATRLFMDQFHFYDKPLSTWMNEMAVILPKDHATPQLLQEKYLEIARKHQRASNYYTIASAIHGGLTAGGDIKKSDLVRSLVTNYTATNRRRPAAPILERMAESYMNSTAHTKVAAKVVKDFWRERRDALEHMRKCLEQVSISVATEMKYQE